MCQICEEIEAVTADGSPPAEKVAELLRRVGEGQPRLGAQHFEGALDLLLGTGLEPRNRRAEERWERRRSKL